ncbi:tetratricopeptide repeat protein [Hymenobacter psoromatis]|uniref:tetratricopeptide repeat protein n=1 Tax=Hymenobacter psoromatis TaxID=1484116 RepID=UPI0021D41FB9|nr:tetratricopeptide repeat protein [Hymenobacter psoromatis]
MNLRATAYLPAALALLALATGCATTTETDRPTAGSSADVLRSAPSAATPAAEATGPTALPMPDPAAATAPTPPGAAEALDAPSAEAATATADPNALSTSAASAERAAERKLTAADYRYQLARANLVLKTKPRDARARLERAKAYSNLKKYQEAKPDYVAALRAMRGNPDVYYNKGVNELMLKEYKAASTDFSGAVKFRPDDKEAFFGRGVAKMQMYQYKAAVSDFTRALAIDSLYADALEYRGISYSSYDRVKEARRDLEKAARLNPEAERSLRRYGKSNSMVRGGKK